jgi:tyrosyl-tRNA synthetase
MPLLEGLDGVQKMSKSLGNYVGIDEPPGAMFGKIMSIPDSMMLRYYELLSDIIPADLARLEKDLETGAKHPRQAKEELAVEIVARYHGSAAAGHAAQEFAHIFREGGLPEEIDEITLAPQGGDAGFLLPNLIVEAGAAPSTSEARRLIKQGGVKLDGEKVTDASLELSPGRTFLLQVGKRRFKKVTLKADV